LAPNFWHGAGENNPPALHHVDTIRHLERLTNVLLDEQTPTPRSLLAVRTAMSNR